MNMMHRLLSYVNNVWNTQAKEQVAIRLRKHNGYHSCVSVSANQLHLHTLKYSEALPVKQSVVLDNLTIEELATILEGMGYAVDVMQESHLTTSATTLIPQQNTRLDTDLCVFTSDVWRMLYPIANLLEMVKGDVDKAIQQMFLRSSSGKWLDYWASFFAVKRLIGESDGALIKRIILFLINPKTNNRSIEELMKLVLGMDVEVADAEPSVFDVYLEADAMTATEESDRLLNQIKAGGVHFIYNYRKRLNEDYNGYVYDVYGKPVAQLDNGAPQVETAMHMDETDFRSQIFDMLGWLIETPMEIFKDVINALDSEGEFRWTEDGYRQAKNLLERYEEFAVAFTEARVELTAELTSTIDFKRMDESVVGRIYEELELPIYEFFYAEINAPIRDEGAFTLIEMAERHRLIELQDSEVFASEMDHGYIEEGIFREKLTEYVHPFSNEMWVFDEYEHMQAVMEFSPTMNASEPHYQLVDISSLITSEVLYNEPTMYAKILEVLEVFGSEHIYTDMPRARQEASTIETEFSFTDEAVSDYVESFVLNESLLNGPDRLFPTSIEKTSPKASGYMVLMDSNGNTLDTLTMD